MTVEPQRKVLFFFFLLPTMVLKRELLHSVQ